MRCPIDGETLVMTERSGVEIDYCPKCRGVWLDRGELDKILDRAAAPAAPTAPTAPLAPEPIYQPEPGRPAAAPAQPAPPPRSRRRDDDDDDDDDAGEFRHAKRYKRRESFLSDLFDF